MNNGNAKIEDSVANELNMQTRNTFNLSNVEYWLGVSLEALNEGAANKATSFNDAHIKQPDNI